MKMLFLPFLLQTSLLAGIVIRTEIKPIRRGGAMEEIGTMRFTISDDGFNQTSKANPGYLQIRLKGLTLAHTLVDRAENGLHNPINLPVWIEKENTTFHNPPPDAVQIVRWRKGESEIWLRFSDWFLLLNQQSEDELSLAYPSWSETLVFELGRTADDFKAQLDDLLLHKKTNLSTPVDALGNERDLRMFVQSANSNSVAKDISYMADIYNKNTQNVEAADDPSQIEISGFHHDVLAWTEGYLGYWTDSEAIITHLTPENSFFRSQLQTFNPFAQAYPMAIHGFDSQGHLIVQREVILEPGYQDWDPYQIFDPQPAYLACYSHSQIRVDALYISKKGARAAATLQTNPETEWLFPLRRKGQGFHALTVVNRNSQPAVLSYQASNQNGFDPSQAINIGPNQKLVLPLAVPEESDFVWVHSDIPLALSYFSGSLPESDAAWMEVVSPLFPGRQDLDNQYHQLLPQGLVQSGPCEMLFVNPGQDPVHLRLSYWDETGEEFQEQLAVNPGSQILGFDNYYPVFRLEADGSFYSATRTRGNEAWQQPADRMYHSLLLETYHPDQSLRVFNPHLESLDVCLYSPERQRINRFTIDPFRVIEVPFADLAQGYALASKPVMLQNNQWSEPLHRSGLPGSSRPFSPASPSQWIDVPDPYFAKYLKGYDFNDDGNLTRQEAGSVYLIGCDSCGISDLSGIEFFESLWSMDFSNNLIHTVPDLSHLNQLRRLELSHNFLATLPKTPSSTEVWAHHNLFDATICPDVLGFNTPNGPYINPSRDGTYVYCSAPGPDEAYLEIPDPKLKTALLRVADGDGNGEISAKEAALVTHLNIANQDISSLQGLQSFPALIQLNCSQNKLSTLRPIYYTKIQFLDCSENQITEVAQSALGSVQRLNISHNRLESMVFVRFMNELLILDISHNLLTEFVPPPVDRLHTLDVSWNALEELDLSPFKGVSSLLCHNNQLSRIIHPAECYWRMYCQNNQLTELILPHNHPYDNVSQLNCSYNQLTRLSLTLENDHSYADFSYNFLSCSALESVINPNVKIAIYDPQRTGPRSCPSLDK
ncbi:MAG: hypothetical protein H6510_00400 [Acidobacteria bacterium]|nr:hypothetical protein [Acidobacteriota bacterium]MCB9396248.1 hypothetical protein [Acidobacteriota bacterium]